MAPGVDVERVVLGGLGRGSVGRHDVFAWYPVHAHNVRAPCREGRVNGAAGQVNQDRTPVGVRCPNAPVARDGNPVRRCLGPGHESAGRPRSSMSRLRQRSSTPRNKRRSPAHPSGSLSRSVGWYAIWARAGSCRTLGNSAPARVTLPAADDSTGRCSNHGETPAASAQGTGAGLDASGDGSCRSAVSPAELDLGGSSLTPRGVLQAARPVTSAHTNAVRTTTPTSPGYSDPSICTPHAHCRHLRSATRRARDEHARRDVRALSAADPDAQRTCTDSTRRSSP